MNVTYHAGERFLQRVFNLTKYTTKQVRNAMKLIENDIQNIHHRSKNFILPSFPEFTCIVKENALVTIIPKHPYR